MAINWASKKTENEWDKLESNFIVLLERTENFQINVRDKKVESHIFEESKFYI